MDELHTQQQGPTGGLARMMEFLQPHSTAEFAAMINAIVALALALRAHSWLIFAIGVAFNSMALWAVVRERQEWARGE